MVDNVVRLVPSVERADVRTATQELVRTGSVADEHIQRNLEKTGPRLPIGSAAPSDSRRWARFPAPRDRGECYERMMAISTCAGPTGETLVSPPNKPRVNFVVRVRGH